MGILWIMHGHRPHPQRFSCVQPTSHFSFGISFKLLKWLAMAEIWPPYGFGCSGESKTSNILTVACVQAVGHSFFQFPTVSYLVHELVGMTSFQPIFFVGLGSKSSE